MGFFKICQKCKNKYLHFNEGIPFIMAQGIQRKYRSRELIFALYIPDNKTILKHHNFQQPINDLGYLDYIFIILWA